MHARFFIAGMTLLLTALPTQAADCPSSANLNSFFSNGWGFGALNHRFQSRTSITRDNVKDLQLKWVFPLDENMQPHSYPLVTEDTIFVATGDGNLYALDRNQGCIRWRYQGGEYIRTAIVHGELQAGEADSTLLFFGTSEGMIHAVRASDGSLAWKVDVKDHPAHMVTGSPLLVDGDLYVPLSSKEVALALSPFYECCTSRGSLVRMSATDGSITWRSDTIDEPAIETGRHWLMVKELGPSGAPVWSAPALDSELGLLFIGTGENYTRPATATSDAILAIDARTGVRRWQAQFTGDDAWNMACSLSPEHPNCPQQAGPDLDFGAPPILFRRDNGDTLLLAGQKSARVYGIDASSGKTLWQQHLGRGGRLGGVHWGMAIHPTEQLLYVPINDLNMAPAQGEPMPGLYALDIETGEIRWSASQESRCSGREQCRDGFSAAALATPELVFVSVLDGTTYAVDALSGDFLWEYDSWRDYGTVNDIAVNGGAIDAHGPMIAGDQLIIQSGYDSFGQRGGNALLVFQLEPEQ